MPIELAILMPDLTALHPGREPKVCRSSIAAYVQTQGLTFGDSGRNSLNNPRRTNFDMSVYKVFKPKEQLAVQFRAEAFNIFNHTEWNGVNNAVSTTNFLFSTGAHMPRVLQFALRITF